jgi:ATP-dependent helicase HrpB
MTLPIDAVLTSLQAALATHPGVVLQAPPGAGKTTRVPLALLDQPWLAGRILMLEPRRIAARAAATFMSRQRGEPVGQTVGYRTRMDSRVSAQTRIEVVTEGILTRLIQRDPSLADYGLVIFDEFHERSLQADLGLALVREVQQALREDLRLLVMSATLDGTRIATLLNDAPVLVSEGRSFPVSVLWRPPGRTPWLDHLAAELAAVVAREDTGSVLVFLPGTGEIRRLAGMLEGRLPADVMLAPLYGDLAATDQDAAIAPAPAGRRKLVLATAIAETSLTIEGVTTVVDAGFDRRPLFDPGTGMGRLETVRVSAASAEQRAGRAGRLGPGSCIRLWAESERLAPFARAEMLDADLSSLALELAQWGCRDPATLVWLDPPPSAAWQQAVALLVQLEALDASGAVTAHGRALLAMPLTPRLAHMVVRGRERGLAEPAAILAVLLSERDLLRDAGTDIRLRMEALTQGRGADRSRLAFLRQAVQRLLPDSRKQTSNTNSTPEIDLWERQSCRDTVPESGGDAGGKIPSRQDGRSYRNDDTDSAGLLLALAFPDRVGRRRAGSVSRYLLSNGRGAVLPDHDSVASSEFIVAASLDGGGREARVFLAAPLDREDLESLFAERIVAREQGGWDRSSQSVKVWRRRYFGQLVLDEQALPLTDPALLAEGMITGIREQGADCLPWHESLRQWQARVQWMAKLEPDQWPSLTDEQLMASLEQWALPWLAGIHRLDQLSRFPLREALRSLLTPAQRQHLDAELPEHLLVPTGTRVAIDYCHEGGPVLAVKLQELFGMVHSPKLAGGRVPLLIHLLSPARRPVAVTSDLASFWQQGYPQVRKELRGRYPKHPWPEDPVSAAPQRGVKHPKPR